MENFVEYLTWCVNFGLEHNIPVMLSVAIATLWPMVLGMILTLGLARFQK